MTKTLGPVAAVLATASFAIAGGGEGDGPKGAKPNARKMDELASRAAPQEGVTTDAQAGKGFTISKGDDFSINLANRVQVLYRYSALDDTPGTPGPDTSGFSIPRARTKLSGHVFDPRVQYQLQLDWASSSSLVKDAWARYVFYESDDKGYQIGARFGQQKTRFGLEAEGTSGGLEHTDRSIASRTFAGVRSTGLWIEGAAKLGEGAAHWQVGAANSDTAGGAAGSVLESGADNAANVDNELDYYFGLSFDPFGDMGGEGIGQSNYMQGDLENTEKVQGRIGAGLMVGNHRNAIAAAPNSFDVETISYNIHTAWKIQGIHALAELFARSDETDLRTGGNVDADSIGYAFGGSYTMPKPEGGGPQWGGALRYSAIDLDAVSGAAAGNAFLLGSALGGGSGEVSEINVAVNAYYHKHALKTQLGYTFQNVDADGATTDLDNHILDVFFQVMF